MEMIFVKWQAHLFVFLVHKNLLLRMLTHLNKK